MSDLLVVDRGPVRTITLDRPDSKNGLTYELARQASRRSCRSGLRSSRGSSLGVGILRRPVLLVEPGEAVEHLARDPLRARRRLDVALGNVIERGLGTLCALARTHLVPCLL